jgi:predicted kinase
MQMNPCATHWLDGSNLPASLDYGPGGVVLLGGLPGVGKTTLTERLMNEHACLCLDDYRERFGGLDAPYDQVRAAFLADLDSHLRTGDALIIDSTALRADMRQAFVASARSAARDIHLLYLLGDRQLVDAGQDGRERQVPERAVIAYIERQDELLALARSVDLLAEGFASCTLATRAAINSLTRISL